MNKAEHVADWKAFYERSGATDAPPGTQAYGYLACLKDCWRCVEQGVTLGELADAGPDPYRLLGHALNIVEESRRDIEAHTGMRPVEMDNVLAEWRLALQRAPSAGDGRVEG